MKRTIAIIALAVTTAFIVMGQTGCASKADAASDAKGVEKKVKGGQNKKTGEAAGFINPS